MRPPPDHRPGSSTVWVVTAIAVVATAVGVWWIVRSRPSGGPAAGAVATHEPCEPASSAGAPSGSPGPVGTEDWEITVTGARAEPSVPARDSGTYTAAPGEVFIVVDVRFRNLHPGTEAPLSTGLVRLRCSDGTEREMAGFDAGQGFCRVCGLDLGTTDRTVRWSFLFRMTRRFLAQPFVFRYGTAQPVPLALGA